MSSGFWTSGLIEVCSFELGDLGFGKLCSTHRLLSSLFLGLPYRILNMNHKKALLRSL